MAKAVAFCLALVASCVVVTAEAQAADCPATLANQLADTGTATQLITVVAPRASSPRGSLQTWHLVGDCWQPVAGPWPAWLGQRGVSERKREGDRRTPAGAFGIGKVMYGVAPNPGVRYRYRRVRCGDWWVEDPRSPFYNQFRRTPCGSRPPFRTTGDDMWRSPTAYRHLAVVEYNMDPVVPGRGSGIFLHASTGRPTLGCVSLPLPRLTSVLRWLRPSAEPLIVIGTNTKIRMY